MKLISLSLILVLAGCSTTGVDFEYPDCIAQPSEVVQSDGCGNVFLYQFLDSTTALVVRINALEINLTKECQTIYLENEEEIVSVTLEIAGTSPDSVYFNYCDDVAFINQGNLEIYSGAKGTVTFSVSEDDPIKDPIWESYYRISVEISGLHLYDESDELKMVIDKIVFWDIGVGWMPG